MKKIPSKLIVAVAAASLATLVCCENKELAAKQNNQRLEIKQLEAELDLLQDKLEIQSPPDHAEDLELTRKKIETTRAEVEKLDKEIASLKKKRRQMEEEFENYRRKYRVASDTKNNH